MSVLIALLLTPAVQAQDSGILKIHTNVEGAEVYLDGTLIGTAPLTRYVSAGEHLVRIVADNYDPYVRKIDVGTDRTVDLEAALSPGQGTVEFTGPPGAVLWIGEEEQGYLPIRLQDLSTGVIQWRVDAPKYEPATGELSFVTGKNYMVDVKLASSAGVVIATTDPPGAVVRIDGAERGTTPVTLSGITPGSHSVEISLDGYASVIRSFDNSDGERAELDLELTSRGGTVVIDTGDADGKVYFNGALVGSGRSVRVGPLVKGKTQVRVESSGKTYERTVNVPAAGRLELRIEEGRINERPPLTRRWGFWAVIGGGAAAAGAATTTAVILSQPEPPPSGDVVVELP